MIAPARTSASVWEPLGPVLLELYAESTSSVVGLRGVQPLHVRVPARGVTALGGVSAATISG